MGAGQSGVLSVAWSSKWKGLQQDLFSSQSKLHSHLLSLLSMNFSWEGGRGEEGDRQAGRGGVGGKRVTGKINETPL